MNYDYVKVSSVSQNIDRQINEMYKLGLIDKYIFIDKQNGKDFERNEYQKLRKMIYLLLNQLIGLEEIMK